MSKWALQIKCLRLPAILKLSFIESNLVSGWLVCDDQAKLPDNRQNIIQKPQEMFITANATLPKRSQNLRQLARIMSNNVNLSRRILKVRWKHMCTLEFMPKSSCIVYNVLTVLLSIFRNMCSEQHLMPQSNYMSDKHTNKMRIRSKLQIKD